MSSVQGMRKCPKCGGTLFYDMDCRTTEVYEMCLRCGYQQQCILLRNDDGTVKMGDDGEWLMDCKETVGYGAARLCRKEGIGGIYAFENPLSAEDQAALIEDLHQPDTDEGSYAVLFDPQSGSFTVLAGNLPEDYTEEDDG